MPASMLLETVKGNEKWFSVVHCSGFSGPCCSANSLKLSSITHSNWLLILSFEPLKIKTTLSTNSYQFWLISSDTGKNGIILLVSLLKQQPNDQPNYALQQTTAYMYLSYKSNGFALSLPLFSVRFRIHKNNEAHQPYMIHQITSKMLNNAIKINYQPTRAILFSFSF